MKNTILFNQLCRIALFLPLGFSVSAQQADTQAEHIATIIDAKPLERVSPKYPTSAAINRQEGWVRVSFVIDEQGKVIDPVVQDSSGLSAFEKASLEAVSQWQYSPALQDGKPIEQCQMQVQMDFKLNEKLGVSRRFYQKYRQIEKLLTDKQLDKAGELLNALGDGQLWNMTESAYYWLLDSVYARETNDSERELDSVNRALAIHEEDFKAANQRYLLDRQFVLALNQSRILSALKTYQRIEKIDDNQELIERFKPYADQAKALLEGNTPLLREVQLGQQGLVYHELSRNSFSLLIDDGQLDELEIRCANKRSRFTVASETLWQIPASWGQCTVFVTGSPGSQFKIVEQGQYNGIVEAGI